MMKPLQLILTNPCTEQWGDIFREDGKHYCNVCEKNIVDLTEKSDQELIEFFQNKKKNLCGRLLESQLNRKLHIPNSGLKFRWLMPLALGVTAVAPVFAQNSKPIVTQPDSVPVPLNDIYHQSVEGVTIRKSIIVKVIDHVTGKPLKGVKIMSKAYQNVLATTDVDGRFELSITETNAGETFVFYLPNYSRITSKVYDQMVVALDVERRVMMGAIAVVNLNHSPLYVIQAGRRSCTIEASRMGEISPDWIQKIDVLKDASATAIYGGRGANGVIMVEIKKEFYKKIDFSKKK